MRQFDDATRIAPIDAKAPPTSCPANPTWWWLSAVLAMANLAVGIWWLAMSFDSGDPTRLLLVAASLPAVAWMAVKSLRGLVPRLRGKGTPTQGGRTLAG